MTPPPTDGPRARPHARSAPRADGARHARQLAARALEPLVVPARRASSSPRRASAAGAARCASCRPTRPTSTASASRPSHGDDHPGRPAGALLRRRLPRACTAAASSTEQYFNGMERDTPHLLQSVSKSVVGGLAGVLVGAGRLEPEAPLTEYVPELAGTSFEGATVRHLLDMTAGTQVLRGLRRPGVRRAVCTRRRSAGGRPACGDDELDLLGYIVGPAEPTARTASAFEYRSILTDVLGHRHRARQRAALRRGHERAALGAAGRRIRRRDHGRPSRLRPWPTAASR